MTRRATRSNRTGIPTEIPTSKGVRSRDGCWTCRIRRKKCDEQKDLAGSCQNCCRLQIQCAGFSEQQPEWMKDLEQLQRFKASITRQVNRRPRASSAPASHDSQFTATYMNGHPQGDSDFTEPQQLTIIIDEFPSRDLINQPSQAPIVPFNSVSPQATFTLNSVPVDHRKFIQQVVDLASFSDLPTECHEAIGQIAVLARWKSEQFDRGSLSYRELARRGLKIEQSMYAALENQMEQNNSVYIGEVDDWLTFMRFPEEIDEENLSNSTLGSWSPPTEPSVMGDYTITKPWFGQDMRTTMLGYPYSAPVAPYPNVNAYQDKGTMLRGSGSLTHLATLLVLHAVVSGVNPRVPEIIETSNEILRHCRLDILSKESLEQKYFAAALAGCLSEREEAKQVCFSLSNLIVDERMRALGLELMHTAPERH